MFSRAAIASLTLNLSLLSTLAASVTLDWDPSQSPNVASYKLYYGAASGVYTSSIAAGSATSATLPGLADGATYFAAVTCSDSQGVESAFSNELKYTVPPGATALPAPWQTADVGPVKLAGSASASSGIFTITGSGKISSRSDTFRFVYQGLSGDGEIRAQVRSIQNGGAAGDTGVMIRENLTAGSRYVMAGITASGANQWQNRKTTGGSTSYSYNSGATSNAWVRLVRSGNTNTFFRSVDGTSWTRMGSVNITMASNIYFGLAVASGATNTLNTSSLGNVIAIP